MMWTRIASLQLWILLLQLSLKQASASLEEGPCRELAFPSFLFFANKRLVNHTIKDVQVGNMGECERFCYEEYNCVSINFERKRNGDGKYHCELNNSTHGEHDQDLVDTENYFYRGTKNACGTTPCRNGGTCQSGFTKKRYRCLCPPGFTGGQCREDIDECVDGTHNCSDNADCSKTKRSYNCTCKPGYFGDGRNCTAMMDSVILSNNKSYLQHLGMFLASAVGYNCQWRLCYRNSTHGDSDYKFHTNCNGKNYTVTIVKKDEFVFGGFTDIAWESREDETKKFGETSNAFIFSLRDAEGLAPFKSTVKDPSKAILNVVHVGPTFGEYDLRIDRVTAKSSTKKFGQYYQTPDGNLNSDILAGSEEFQPDEVEVFYLV